MFVIASHVRGLLHHYTVNLAYCGTGSDWHHNSFSMIVSQYLSVAHIYSQHHYVIIRFAAGHKFGLFAYMVMIYPTE